jgi:hypothetical protein
VRVAARELIRGQELEALRDLCEQAVLRLHADRARADERFARPRASADRSSIGQAAGEAAACSAGPRMRFMYASSDMRVASDRMRAERSFHR